MTINSKIRVDNPQDTIQKKLTSTKEERENAIRKLNESKDRWPKIGVREKIDFLEDAIQKFGSILDDWVNVNLAAKDALDDPYAVGMEWIGGPVAVLRYLQGLRTSLMDIANRDVPKFSGPVVELPNGQVAVYIYPSSLYERIVTPGVKAEVWMEPGISAANLPKSQAVVYNHKQHSGSVVLVLGGGNIAGIPINDSMSKLFVENKVVLLKLNPVNEYLGPLITDCFEKLVAGGFFQVVYGGAEEGKYLSQHPQVDEIHMTGSDKTHDIIIFGSGEDGKQRKAEKQLLVTKRFTCELGNIGPAIIVPGPWQSKDFTYQAEQLASHLTDNASFSCSRTRVIINHAAWPFREKLLQNLRAVLSAVPLRSAYYPGAHALYRDFISAHPEAETFGTPERTQLPWTLIAGINPAEREDICFTTESFCPVIAETSIQADTIVEYIDRAVDFANNTLWGTLSAAIIVHPSSLDDPEIAHAVEKAIMNLRVGHVIINGIPGMAWLMTTPPWGSFPGNEIHDIQSGIGHVHNIYMFSKPQKTVIRCPFKTWPKPIWFNSRARAFKNVAQKIAQYDLNPSWRKIPGIVIAALIN